MKSFDVFEHPVRGVEAIKHGFSWPAFFFQWWWALFHRLWLRALLLFALLTAPGVITFFSSTLESALLTWAIFVLVGCVLAGGSGNDWRRENVLKRGFTYLGTEQADTPDAAIATVIRKRQNETKSI